MRAVEESLEAAVNYSENEAAKQGLDIQCKSREEIIREIWSKLRKYTQLTLWPMNENEEEACAESQFELSAIEPLDPKRSQSICNHSPAQS